MVETALHSPVEVCLFLFFYLDCVIIPGRGGGFFPFLHKISSFFCSGPYYYVVSRKNFFRISFGFFCCCFMFLYKTFWNLYKTKYFLYKNRRKFQHVFSGFPWFFIRTAKFFCFFFWFFPWKNPFLEARPSVNDRIYSYRPYIFHAFFVWFDKFFSFFSRSFLHFSVRLRKKSAAFSSGSSVFWDFFASSE